MIYEENGRSIFWMLNGTLAFKLFSIQSTIKVNNQEKLDEVNNLIKLFHIIYNMQIVECIGRTFWLLFCNKTMCKTDGIELHSWLADI